MLNVLNQPYPTEESASSNVTKAVGTGLFVGLFLLVFQPFGLDDWQTSAKTGKILGFGVVTLVVMLANYFIAPALFPHYFSDKRWTVAKEISRILVFITVIAFGNRLYLGWLTNESEVMGGWLWAIGITFLIGLFPTAGFVVLNYINQLKKYSRAAGKLPVHSPMLTPAPNGKELADAMLTLIAENEKDSLTIVASDLLFIESSDNYCTVFYLKNEQVTKPLFRSSLSRLEKQIRKAHIVRCHRSYVVNLDRVERVTGNAQGYKLHVVGGQFQLPVARQYNETLVAQLKAL
ncbi:LytR/AlgR family response regulator transcription factor [Spirosoma areae]